jgi:hypothetical protein
VGKHRVHDGTYLTVDEWRQGERPPRVGRSRQQSQRRETVRGDRNHGTLATTAPLAEHAAVEHSESDPAASGDRSATLGTSQERRRVPDKPEHGQFGVRDQCPHEAVGEFVRPRIWIMVKPGGGECSQGGMCDIEQFRLRIAIRSERIEQFGDIHAAEKRRLAPANPKPMLETGFRHQIERIGRFPEDEYLTD